MHRFLLHTALLSSTLIVVGPGILHARETTLAGSFSVREGYDSNVYRENTNEQKGWTTTLSPGLLLTSEGSNDTVSFSYSPGFSFAHYGDEEKNTDHHLALSGEKDLSAYLHASINESFIKSDSSYLEAAPFESRTERLLAENRRRGRQWTNTFAVNTDYTYAADSVFSLGYANNILDSRTGDANDYVRHNPHTSLSYRFNQQWLAAVSYSFIRGEFEPPSEDRTTHNPGLQISYNISPHSSIFTNYAYSDIKYDGIREDYSIHDASLGWEQSMSPQTTLHVAGGYSYADRRSAVEAFRYSLNLARTLSHGAFSLIGAGGLEGTDYSGIASDGLTKFWSAGTTYSQQLAERISLGLHASFRKDEFVERILNRNEKTYQAGGGLSFGFMRWLTLRLRYDYLQLDADNDADNYKDHRVFAELRLGGELMRW